MTEKDDRQRNVLNSLQPDGRSPSPQTRDHDQDLLTHVSSRRNRRLRDSVVSFSAVHDSFGSKDKGLSNWEVPEEAERPLKSKRFSLLKFRHASDSQLSKTAKEHGEQTPPVPTCMFDATSLMSHGSPY